MFNKLKRRILLDSFSFITTLYSVSLAENDVKVIGESFEATLGILSYDRNDKFLFIILHIVDSRRDNIKKT